MADEATEFIKTSLVEKLRAVRNQLAGHDQNLVEYRHAHEKRGEELKVQEAELVTYLQRLGWTE